MVTRREGVSGEGEMGKRVHCVVTDRSRTSSGVYRRVYTEAVVYTEIKIALYTWNLLMLKTNVTSVEKKKVKEHNLPFQKSLNMNLPFH